MKQIRIRINNLLDQHEEGIYQCKGCVICTEIKQLSQQLQRDSSLKFQHILDKRSDMTKSDIAFLLENDVHVKKIRDYAGISNQDFYNMMNNYGFSKKRLQTGRKDEMATITVEEFIQLHHVQGLKRNEICELKGIKPNALSNWKWNHKAEIENALLSNVQHVKEEVKPIEIKTTPIVIDTKIAEYERVIMGLKHEISALKATCVLNKEEFNKLMIEKEKLEHVNAACEDVENEIASLREENERYLKQQHHDSYIRENQSYQLGQYAMENEKLQEENKALKFFARRYLAVE
jgi:hypothetical protein